MDAAGQVLKRAVELDNEEKYSEALVCYQEGIDILFTSVKQSADDKFKANARLRLNEYMNRAEQLKEFVSNQKEVGKYHEKIELEAGQRGCSYSRLFSKYIDEKLTTVRIQDPYIRTHHQIMNLLRFCELLIKKAKNLNCIKLITTAADFDHAAQQFEKLEQLQKSLKDLKVNFDFEMLETLHDREIELDNGWVIKIGRGLDYFRAPLSKFAIGSWDFDLRECLKTTIDIYSKK
ncbi:MIT domain-containing protein 1-like [Rhopilema esculentum]|uniref:MIT domain-containing protein 1-like n=1 Tax=Rhopilema esculentum TaxID=499914 RepID=UPI0031D796E5|eukprot:gene12734-3460_t